MRHWCCLPQRSWPESSTNSPGTHAEETSSACEVQDTGALRYLRLRKICEAVQSQQPGSTAAALLWEGRRQNSRITRNRLQAGWNTWLFEAFSSALVRLGWAAGGSLSWTSLP
jgi:hypothetical protein